MYSRNIKPQEDSFHEECGIFGIYSMETRDVANTVYYGLYALQHRGQESGGIAVVHANKMEYYKNAGLIPEVFTQDVMDGLPDGDIAMGHVRYSSASSNLPINAQPIVFTGKCGKMAIAHNGNIVNASKIKEDLLKENAVFQTTTDAEVMALLINKFSENGDAVTGVRKACEVLKGAYAFILMTCDKLIAVRDPFGIRPICLGKIGDEYILASESCGLDAVSATYVRDLEPGEILVIDAKGLKSYKHEKCGSGACIFEHVYFARPDSIIDGDSVYEARMEAGRILAKKYPVDADLISGVPDSALVSARGFAEVSGIPYVDALAKNRYVGRTFIQPGQSKRENSVSVKLNALKANVAGKRVVLVDDSIVRGTTSKKIVTMLRLAGAKEIHMRISSPIVKHPCFFGVDMQNYSQLIGAYRTEEEIRQYIGADSLKFLSIEDMVNTVKDSKCKFCLGCFSGEYPFPIDEFVNLTKLD